MEQRLAVHEGQGSGAKSGSTRVRDQGAVQLGGAPAEQRGPLQVRADQRVAGLEGRPPTSRSGRGGARRVGVGGRQQLLEAWIERVDQVVPAVALVGDELFEQATVVGMRPA